MKQTRTFWCNWIIAAFLNLGLATSASAQLDKYQAAATLRTWVYSAEGIATRCRTRFPSIAPQIERDIATWKRNDKIAINRALLIWREMEIASPRPREEEQEDRAQLEQLWRSLTERQPDDPPNFGQARCSQYFQHRAGGILRSRQPEVFSILELK